MKPVLFISCSLLFANTVFSQSASFRGSIRDEIGKICQNVLIVQGSTGYIYYSDATGSFNVPAQHASDTLHVSFDGYEKQVVTVRAGSPLDIVLHRMNLQSILNRRASLTRGLRFDLQQQWFIGDETYASTVRNGFVAADRFPATTMALNVDKASYSNIRQMLLAKMPVPPEAVRLEELLNYFNIDYRETAAGASFELDAVLTPCPWNKANQVLMATVRTRKVNADSLPPSHLVFLVDASASMDAPNRLPLLKAGFRGLVQNLRPKDSVSIVIYGGQVGILLPATSGGEKQRILNAIDSLQPGGGTPGESGVKLAYRVAREHFIPKGNNRVILATDGDFNVGIRSDDELEQLILNERKSGVYLTCLGVGMGNYKDAKIQTLAQRGNGNFAYIDNYAEAEKVLMKEFLQTLYTVADDASLQVQFNPAFVKQYRLLGFDNKVGAIKDTASVVEGRELGSGYALRVAFEIEPSGAPKQGMLPATFQLSYRRPGSATQEKISVSPALNLTSWAELNRSHQFAAAVLLFGSVLQESPHVKEGTWNELHLMAERAADPADASQREFVLLVEKAKALYGSRKRKGRL